MAVSLLIVVRALRALRAGNTSVRVVVAGAVQSASARFFGVIVVLPFSG